MALVVDDPDAPAGSWVHRVLWGLPADAGGVPYDGAPPAVVIAHDGVERVLR